MNERDLWRAGRLTEAVHAVGAALRDHPDDADRRLLLFYLLCFAGDYDRAERQLAVLERGGPEINRTSQAYRRLLDAERTRQDMFRTGAFPSGDFVARPVSGTLNGKAFQSLTDADPRIGARLELFVGGHYVWMPLELVASIHMSPPSHVGDLLWAPATVQAVEGAERQPLGDVLLPGLTPLAFADEDEAVRLGYLTTSGLLDDGTEVPVGRKQLLVDGEEFPILELRDLEIIVAPAAVA